MTTTTTNICFSGGAVGADKAWGEIALQANHKLIHYVFEGHFGSKGPNSVVLQPDQLKRADRYLEQANRVLNRSWPAHSNFVSNLLRRNYWQICNSEAVYAVAETTGTTVHGGTAWAVEMFKILNPDSERVFTFNEKNKLWYQWRGYSWAVIAEDDVPTPSGKWTGIGTRDLTQYGEDAIRGLFR